MSDESMQVSPNGSDGLLRFNLAMQRSRAIFYLCSLIFGSLAVSAGVLEGSLRTGYAIIGVGIASALAFHYIYKSKLDQRLRWPVFWIWLLWDLTAVTLGVYASGGVSSPWYLFYLAVSACAAFTAGAGTAWTISSLNALAYLGMLFAAGFITPFDHDFYRALYQIGFLYFCSAFFFHGIGNLRQKRLLIRELREEDRKRVAELTRLAEELDMKSEELVLANQKIREADRMKSQFLASMSHELRTPMNAIIGFSEILSERLKHKIDTKHHGFIGHILSSGQHLLGIINDVLDLSKIEAGRMEVFPESFQISQVANEVASVMKGNAAKADVTLNIDLPADMPLIETDLPKLRQILFNLLSNAIKFSPDGGQVVVTGRLDGDPQSDLTEFVLAVSDQGPGIPAEHHEMIFQEFRQLNLPSRGEDSGTGLGLALVKRFCELLGGSVSLESETGQGSTFTVRLPLHYPGAESSIDSDAIHIMDSDKPRVLVVEDDDVAYDALSNHLVSGGYAPVRARHGDEAIRLATTLKPVAITLDLVLPGLDGWDVLKRIKSDPETAQIPVVIISMIDNRELGLALGAHDYFVKPVDRRRLVERIRQVTGKALKRGPTHLLVIDDDPAFRDLLGDDLANLGYTVSWAPSGKEGVAMARADLPDVVVLDLIMPGMTGFEVAEELKQDETTVQIPILVMTSKDLSREERMQLQSQIAAIVPKGRSPASRLLTAIQQLGQ